MNRCELSEFLETVFDLCNRNSHKETRHFLPTTRLSSCLFRPELNSKKVIERCRKGGKFSKNVVKKLHGILLVRNNYA